MFSFLNYKIDTKQIPFFLSLYLFSITLIYIIADGYINNEEIFDLVFLITSFIFIEILFYIFFKNILSWDSINKQNTLLLILVSIFFYFIWNKNILYSYTNFILYFSFLFLISAAIQFYLNKYKIKNFYNNEINFFYLIFISSILLSSLLHEINYSDLNKLLLYLFSFLTVLFLIILSKKMDKGPDIILSLFFFIIFFKVFLISSEKDAFHYAWYLGPVNSLFNYELYNEIVSQYGFLNILAIFKFTKLTDLSSSIAIIIFIISLLFIFFILFIKNLVKVINLPYSILTLFSCLIIFGSIGYGDLTSSIFIPSSSVLRFLPPIITIILFSRVINENLNNTNLILFFISCLISFLWSFESFFFTSFPLFIFLIFKLSYIFFQNYFPNSIKINKKKLLRICVVLGLTFCIATFILLNKKKLLFFYEYALLTNTSLSEKIINNEFTLLFIFLIFISYLILRYSFGIKKIFYHNLIFFCLLISFSVYFINRSVNNNLISLLPFFIFFICSMKIVSENLIIYRKIIIFIFILFSITSSFVSIFSNFDKFKKNLYVFKFVYPVYNTIDYIPSKQALNEISKYYELPLTLITNNIIHERNHNLNSEGYGMPILPLEMFSLLNDERRNNLYDLFFKKKDKHLILCIVECKFFKKSVESNIRNKIFIGDKYSYKKISSFKLDNFEESLYLIFKNY